MPRVQGLGWQESELTGSECAPIVESRVTPEGPTPPIANAFDGKFRGVGRDADVDPALVFVNVVHLVGHGLRRLRVDEIMDPDLDRAIGLAPLPQQVFIGADKLLALGIDGDDEAIALSLIWRNCRSRHLWPAPHRLENFIAVEAAQPFIKHTAPIAKGSPFLYAHISHVDTITTRALSRRQSISIWNLSKGGRVSQTERLYRIERLLHSKKVVPIGIFLQDLQVSRATFNRDLGLLRDRLNVPIIYDLQWRGYRLGNRESGATRRELPGLWFSSREAHALLTFHHFLENIEPGLLSPHIEPLKDRIQTLLESKDQTLKEIVRRIRILPQASRRTEPDCFQLVAHALLARKRLSFHYHGRVRGDITKRTISPQRLVHYRDNWYLDAWDHVKRALRTFAVERIRTPRLLVERTKDISEERLDRYFTESYGIFSGRPKHKAVLRFSPERARWVADETWHPQQKGWMESGHYVLEIPYSDDRELVLDILRHGPDVEVLRPKSLRKKVLDQLLRAVSRYRQ